MWKNDYQEHSKSLFYMSCSMHRSTVFLRHRQYFVNKIGDKTTKISLLHAYVKKDSSLRYQ